jgi:hypothetical protein
MKILNWILEEGKFKVEREIWTTNYRESSSDQDSLKV